MRIRDSVAFVTGANRVLGLVFAQELLAAVLYTWARESHCARPGCGPRSRAHRKALLMTFRVSIFAALGAVFTLAAFTLIPLANAASAAGPKMAQSQAGFYRFKVGDVEIIALSDGTVPLPVHDVLTNVQPGEVDRLLATSYQKAPVDASVNAFLFQIGSKLIMVDAGAGELYGPTLGKLPASIRAAGYSPERITDILLTHIHTDHSGGLMDGNRKVFPNATIHVERREVEYWLEPMKLKNAPQGTRQYFQQAVDKVGPYQASGQVKPFDGETELFPGLRTLPTPGHTPGHSFYVLDSKGEKIVFWGDILHVSAVQFPNPSVTITFDVDSTAAAAQRKKAFADAAQQGYLVAPAHVSFPGVGHLRADTNGYRWIPIPYVNDAYAGGQ